MKQNIPNFFSFFNKNKINKILFKRKTDIFQIYELLNKFNLNYKIANKCLKILQLSLK
jgi:hypothetical protein